MEDVLFSAGETKPLVFQREQSHPFQNLIGGRNKCTTKTQGRTCSFYSVQGFFRIRQLTNAVKEHRKNQNFSFLR